MPGWEDTPRSHELVRAKGVVDSRDLPRARSAGARPKRLRAHQGCSDECVTGRHEEGRQQDSQTHVGVLRRRLGGSGVGGGSGRGGGGHQQRQHHQQQRQQHQQQPHQQQHQRQHQNQRQQQRQQQ